MLAGGADQRPRLNPDSVISLDDAVTPRLVNRGLEDLTATIRRHRIRYLGLVMTDPQDVVFFVERLRRDCPDVALFVTGMDLTYALPENRYAMREVLVASTYPLFPPNQEWTNPGALVQRSFQNEAAQGCYNALIFQIAELEHIVKGNAGDQISPEDYKRQWLREYSLPVFGEGSQHAERPSKPPVWIFSIGENGRCVPHAFFGDYEIEGPCWGDGTTVHPPRLMADGPTPRQGDAVALPLLGAYAAPAAFLLLAASLAVMSVARAKPASQTGAFPVCGPLLQRGGLRRLVTWAFARMNKVEVRSGVSQSLALTVVIINLAALLSTMQIMLSSSFRQTSPQSTLLRVGAALAWLILLCSLLFQARLVIRYAGRLGYGSHIRGLARLGITVLQLLASASFAGCLLIPSLYDGDVPGRVLFAERAVNLQTGFSPLVPLAVLSAGIVVNLYYSDKRRALGRRFHIVCPFPGSGGPTLDPLLLKTWRKIRYLASCMHEESSVFTVFLRRRWRWLAIACFLFGLVMLRLQLGDGDRSTYEGLLWDTVFLVGFVLLAAIVVLDAVIFLGVWKDLESLLKHIAMLPMVGAFDRMPRKAAELFGGYFQTRRPRSTHLIIPLHLIRQLQCEAHAKTHATISGTKHDQADVASGALLPAITDCPARIASCLDQINWQRLTGATGDDEYPGTRFNLLSMTVQQLIGIVANYWPRRSVLDAFGDDAFSSASEAKTIEPSQAKPREKHTPQWVILAEDVIAIQTIIFLSQFFIQLRVLAGSMAWSSVTLMLAAIAYPFQPEKLILYWLFGLLLPVGGLIVWFLVRVNKNEIISRITRSTPNKFELDWQFVTNALFYVGPIVLVIIAQLSGRLRSAVEPLLNSIR